MKNKDLINTLIIKKTNSSILQFSRYFFVGGIAFILDFIFLYIFKEFIRFSYLISASLSFLIGLIVNYVMSISWIFNKEKFTWDSLIKHDFIVFIITGLLGMGLNDILMYTLTDIAMINYLFSKIIAVPVVLLWNFLSRKYFL